MNKNTLKKIAEIVGREHFTTRLEDLHCYSYDGTRKTFLPEVVAFPDSTDQIASLMRLASTHLFSVVARGAGSGMTGGSLPINGGLVMALSRLNHILEIDRDNQIAIVEPGVITGEFQQEVKRLGLFYPPDPASLKFCTMGGNAAECAGGPSAVKYGVTKDFIIGLEVVLASGEILTTGTRTEKGVVGYDLTRLFIGSEGTLGIITKIITRLIPLPEHKETFLISSNSLPQATALVAEILNHNINPCTLEYMDRTALGLVAKLLPAPPAPDIQAILLLEIDGSRSAVFEQTERLHTLLNTNPHCTIRQAATDTERQDLWQARRSISPATFQLSPHKISEDVVVPRTRIHELVQFTEKLAQELDLTILTFGHAGDGNIHVNIMLDLEQEEQRRKGEVARERLFRQVIHLAGTLSGEHGIGITKSKFLPLELNDTTLKIMKQLKTLFDPQGILNPGKIFPTKTSANPL
ncbi:MAG: FAD-linked oxidase C-terminal domain-containing protein [Desulfocapsaceae bacterium]|nr:FAD-linked oxidase C-terminal domain-containing protein [Desulfocapsaceae bacterium]